MTDSEGIIALGDLSSGSRISGKLCGNAVNVVRLGSTHNVKTAEQALFAGQIVVHACDIGVVAQPDGSVEAETTSIDLIAGRDIVGDRVPPGYKLKQRRIGSNACGIQNLDGICSGCGSAADALGSSLQRAVFVATCTVVDVIDEAITKTIKRYEAEFLVLAGFPSAFIIEKEK